MKKFYLALCGGLILTGCSNFTERHQASGDFEYLKEQPYKSIVFPEGFTPLKISTEYDVPEVGQQVNRNLMGAKLDIRAPSLIMPVAPNSLIADSTTETQVVFESFLSQDKFSQELWDKLSTFISSQNYGVNTQVERKSLLTDMIESDEYFKLLFGLEDDLTLSQQYKFDINVDEQGHKAIITVKLVEHKEQDKTVELNQFATRRYEARMMNLFLSQVYAAHNQTLIANHKDAKKGIKLELGFDSEENTVYQVHAPFETVWEKLSIILPQLGLVVDDRDKSVNTYFTHFDDKNSFWSNLFFGNSNDADIELNDKEKYQIKVNERGNTSLLTIVDSEGKRLPAEKMTDMLNAFSELMAKKQL